jgi:hypothetical protein
MLHAGVVIVLFDFVYHFLFHVVFLSCWLIFIVQNLSLALGAKPGNAADLAGGLAAM